MTKFRLEEDYMADYNKRQFTLWSLDEEGVVDQQIFSYSISKCHDFNSMYKKILIDSKVKAKEFLAKQSELVHTEFEVSR